jgi:RHS repeat-associated protein
VSGSFSYDDELRLTQTITDTGNLLGSETETFTLDAVGNRTEHSRVTGPWHYDANNRLTDKGILFDATHYDYDDSGNPIRKTKVGKVTQYVYDTQNRLIKVKDDSGNLIARYGYDLFDRRIWKEQYRDKNGNVLAQAKRSYYLYADEGLIAESRQDITLNADQTVSASAEPAIATQYGPRPNSLFGTGVLLVKTKNSNGDDTFAYYHHDHLETPIQATDKNGNVVWSASYNVFGQATITTPAASLDKPTISSALRLPGQIEDEETGLHYNWHRYYEPGLGRYVTADPIGLLGGVNRYAYVRGNPVNLIDPLGLVPGQPYDTLDEAGIAAVCEINPKSIADNKEYGGSLYRRDDGKYSYTKPERGGERGANYDDNPPGEWIAIYHTHAAYDPSIAHSPWGDRNTNFSDFPPEETGGQRTGDIPLSDELHKPNYMADPKNTIHKYDPNDPKRKKRGRKGEILGKCGCENN